MAPAVQSVEVQFAQRLASNEKVIRDRAVKRLRKYITAKTTSRTGGFSPEELSKIWKGLFYCMWMQDKPLLQENLADTISQLIHAFQNMPAKLTFVQTFWQTICREWNGIDRLRLDKYYLLCRMILRQSFMVLKKNAWDKSLVEEFLNLLTKEVLLSESKAPNGVRFHFIDIYLEELSKVGADELTASQNLELIDPFCKTVAKTKDRILMQAIAQGIFETIVDQAPFAIEDLMNELKMSQRDDKIDLQDEKEKDENDSSRHLKAKANRSLTIEDGVESGESSAEEDENDEHVGESIGPILQFDYKAVADRLFELASGNSTPAQNRKRLYKLVKRFQDLAEGIFPQDDFPEEVSTDEDDEFSSRRFMKKARKNKFSEKIKTEKKKGKDQDVKEELSTNEVEGASVGKLHKKRKRKHESSSPEATAGESVPDSSRNSCELATSKEKMKDSEGVSMETCETTASEVLCVGKANSRSCPQGIPVTGKQNKKKRSKQSSPEMNTECTEMQCENVTRCSELSTETGYTMVDCTTKKKKQKVALGKEDSLPETVGNNLMQSDEGEVSVSLPVKYKIKEKVCMMPTQAESPIRKEKKQKLKKTLSSAKMNVTLKKGNKKNKANKANGNVPLNKKNIKMENVFVKFGKKSIPKPLFCRTTKSNLPLMRTAKQAKRRKSCSSKKVTFGLNKNTTAEFKRTDKSILVSPEGASRVAFNPDHKPEHGVLKTPPLKIQTGALAAKKSLHTPVKKHKAVTDIF